MRDHGERTKITAFGERRGSPRAKALRSGRIVYSRNACSMVCVVLDISNGGAKLVPADMHQCPSRFSLSLAGEPTRRCEVIWRERAQLGVKFT